MNDNFSDLIVSRINKNFSKVDTILNIYLKNPDEKNIHDIRKSIRRAESAYMTLPKKYRKKKKIRDFMDQSKTFFKINSQIRDYDIYLQKIENFKKIENKSNTIKDNKASSSSSSSYKNYNGENKNIISEIQNYRKSKLVNATTVAEELRDLETPEIKKDNEKIQAKINSRFKKITKRFKKKIQKNLPIVIKDETKREELHTLRKDCKRLRYILELKSTNKRKDNKENNDGDVHITKSIEQLENLQDSLGQIHDCDAILAFFENLKEYPEANPLMNKEKEIRKDLYRKFMDKYQNTTQDKLFL